MSQFKDVEYPEEILKEALSILERTRDDPEGKVRKGLNEVTKSVEKAKAKLVLISEDVSPPELVAHLPILCREKSIPFVFVPSNKDLGVAAGLEVGSASVTITATTEAKADLTKLVQKLNELN